MVDTNPQPTAEVPRAQVGQRIMRATGALVIIQVILRFFGLFEKSILGNLFGTGIQADAYTAARKIANPVFQLGEQVIMHSFLPTFVQRMREHGEKDAWKLASTIINLLALLMMGIALLGFFFMPQLLRLFMPGWDPQSEVYAITSVLARIMLVAMIFLATTSFTYSLLNSYKEFALPASADIVLKVTVLVTAIFFAKQWGALAFAVGFLAGAIGKLLVHSVGLRKRLANYRPTVQFQHPGVKQFGILALPLIVGMLFSTLRSIAELFFTSHLPQGSMSAIEYARTICDIPVQVFPYAFGIALFPFLADIAVARDYARLREMLMQITRIMLLIFVPLSIAFIALRFPIISLVYSEGAIKAVTPLSIYAIGMLIGALEIVVLQFFFAQSDTLRPTIVGMVLAPIHIALLWLGIDVIGLGIIAIPLALILYRGSKVVVLYTQMRRKLGSLEGRRTLTTIGKMLVALLPFASILIGGVLLLPPLPAMQELLLPYLGFLPNALEGKMAKLLALAPFGVLTLTAFAAYVMMLHWLRLDEMALLLAKLRGKLRKPKSPEPPLPDAEA